MTSNKTSNINSIGFNDNQERIIKTNLEDNFSIEFLNRISHIIQFNDLTELDIRNIVIKELESVKKKFKDQKIDLKIQKKVIDDIINMSNYEESGARKIKNIIEEKIDDIVVDNILNGVCKINIKELI